MERLPPADAAAALGWLDQREGSGMTGYDATGWTDTVWIVNAMYETDTLPGGLTHDDVRRMEDAAGTSEPPADVVKELISKGTLTGGGLGRSGWPGPGWRRLRWSELATRLDVDPYAIEVPPCGQSFPYVSWPVNIEPPTEGSLDREQFVRLLDHLAAVGEPGSGTACFAYYAPLNTGDFDEQTVYSCELRELEKLYEDEDVLGSPSNVWPEDRSWFVYTDWDLWATKVSGGRELIGPLLDDDDLEAVTLDF